MTIIEGKNISGLIQRTLNYVDLRLIDHGRRVAFIVMKMLEEQKKYSREEMNELCYLALLHDIGAYKTDEIDRMIQFETVDIWEHSIYGYLFMSYLSPLKKWASAILFHHVNFNRIDGNDLCGDVAQIINIADRVEVFLENGGSYERLISFLEDSRGTRFDPCVVDLFLKAEKQYGITEKIGTPFMDEMFSAILFPEEMVETFVKMLIYAIDFRSYYTVTHTVTTAAISSLIAELMQLDQKTQQKIAYGALLHDLGKIGIPVEILEFSGKLSSQAMRVMRTHVDLTADIMGDVVDPETAQIALRHHEKLNGFGYPKGIKAQDLKLSERIVAVADIVSALGGARSYKEVFPKERTIGIINQMAADHLIDSTVVATIIEHFDQIMEYAQKMCSPVIDIYEKIGTEYKILIEKYKMPIL